MKVRVEGDSAVLALWPPSAEPDVAMRGIALRRRLAAQAPPWLREAIPGACSLSVVFDPIQTDAAAVQAHIESLRDMATEPPAASDQIEIPVVYGGYEGADIARVAEHTGLTPEEIARRHAAGKYRVAFMGFTPGFAYIAGLPPELATPRIRTPRLRVPAGSIGIAANFTGVYPGETAGGWNIIGRTAVRVIDWNRPDPFLLKPGMRVTFKAVTAHDHHPAVQDSTHSEGPHPVMEVRAAGLLTTLQDLGRGGYGHQGVPISGAMDRIALRLANLAAGNAENAPGIEFTFPAPKLRFLQKASFALGGADFGAALAGRPVPLYERVDAKPGEELVFDRRRSGHWGYVAPAGGAMGKRYLGSAAADTRCGLGTALSHGMKLSLDGPPPANGRTVPKDLAPLPGDDPVVRFIPGESAESAKLDGATVRLSVLQDRVGYRTEEPELAPGESSMQSEGIPPGTIQLPPDGKPIFLMADRPTTGGYPKLAFFASIDTRVIAQSPPGTRLHFKRITAEEGRRLIKEARDALKAIGGL